MSATAGSGRISVPTASNKIALIPTRLSKLSRSNPIRAAAGAKFLPLAVGAHARHDQPVAGDAKLVLPGDRVADADQVAAFELDQLVADRAVQVVVVGIAVIVFIDAAAAKVHFHEQPRLDQLRKRAIDRRAADLAAPEVAS